MDRFVRIDISGKAGKSISLLINREKFVHSSESFKDCVEDEEVQSATRPPIVTFNSKDLVTWNHLLYWIITGHSGFETTHMPKENRVYQLMRCWLLGETHEGADFQDCAIMYLLKHYEGTNEDFALSGDQVKEVFEKTRPYAPIRTLLAEEIVKQIHGPHNVSGTIEQYFMIDGAEDAIRETLSRFKQVDRPRPSEFYCRFQTVDEESDAVWRKFLVGDGMKLPWTPGRQTARKRKCSTQIWQEESDDADDLP